MSTQPFNSDGGFSTSNNVTGANVVASTNFVGTSLVTNLTSINWSDPIVDITLGAATYITLDNNVFGDPYTGQVTIEGVNGTTQANGNWYYEASSVNQIQLFSDANGTPVDSSAWGAYTSGGLAYTLGYANIVINGQNVTIRSEHGDYNNKNWSFISDGGTVFPTLSVNLHNGDTQTGQTLQFGDPTQQAFITGPTPPTGQAAQRLIIQGQNGGDGEGGDVYVWGGDSNVNGGDIKIYAGDADAAGRGGNIHITGGQGTTDAGEVTITGGQNNGNVGAYVGIQGGQGTTGGGNVDLIGGYTATGPGGNITLTGGGSGSGLGSYGNVSVLVGASVWNFDNTGNLNLPNTGVVYETNIPFGGLSGKTIALKPSGGTSADQQLLVYPTAGADANHLHLTSGNLYNTELFLGNDDLYVKLANTGNIVINSNDSGGNTAQWNFGTDGNLTTPGSSGNITGANVVSAVTFSATGNITGVNLFGNIYPQSGAVLYVDGNRTDTYTANGTINHPYKTVQAALDDATANTTISVAPGLYSENIVMPDLDGICIAGSSEMNTTIANAAPGHTFSWVPAGSVGNSVSKFCLTNLEFINTDTTGTYHTLHIDASNVTYPNTFIGEEMDIQTVDFEGSQSQANTTVYLNNVGAQFFWHSQIYGGAVTVINPGEFRSTSMVIGNTGDPHDFNATYDGNLPRNGLGRNDITLAAGSAVFGNVNLNGHPIYQEDVDSVVIGNLNGANLSTFYASGRDYSPTILAYGQHGVVGQTSGGGITLTFPDPQTSGSSFNYVDFSNGHILGKVSLTKANLLPLSARGYAVVQGQAQFDTTLANGISANGYVAVDLRGANFNQSTLQATGAATIDRSVVTLTSRTATTAGNVISISPPLAAGATYTTAVTPNSNSTVWVTSKNTGNLTVTASANTTVDITVTRNT